MKLLKQKSVNRKYFKLFLVNAKSPSFLLTKKEPETRW